MNTTCSTRIGRNNGNLLSNLTLAKTASFKPYPIYKVEASSIFMKYQHQTPNLQKITQSSRNRFFSPQRAVKEGKLYSKEKMQISRIFSESKHKEYCFSYDKEPTIKINLSSTEFEDPMDSFSLLKHNQSIYNNIRNKNVQREYQSFTKIITEVNKLKDLQKNTKNLIIRAVAPKKINTNFHKNAISRMNSYNLISFNEVRLKGARVYCRRNFPESRQQFTLIADSTDTHYNNLLYLFGGMSSNTDMNCLWRLNIEKFSWECMKARNLQPLPRYGHTSIIYKNKLVLFGGKMIYEPIYAGLDVYNIDANEWYTPSLPPLNNIRCRYGHIASVIGQHMIIHGGINEFNEYINETVLLYLGNQARWTKCLIDDHNCSTPFRAMHSSCTVLPNDILLNPKLTVYSKLSEVVFDLAKNIKELGIYIFGGKEKEESTCSNDLFVLRIGKQRPDWVKLLTKGLGPCPRYLSTMSYYQEGNLVLIHGGKTDLNGNINELGDFYGLELFNLEWIRITINNIVLDKRCGHACFIQDDHFFIFGGMNNQHYIGSSFIVVNLVEHSQGVELKQINNRRSSIKAIRRRTSSQKCKALKFLINNHNHIINKQ